jgi:hypothetical protein
MTDKTQPFIETILSDIQNQPDWRTEAVIAEAYYEGRQFLPEVEQAMRDRGQPTIINNYVAPTINGVLGMEAKTRTDWQVRADDDDGSLINEYLNEQLMEAARLTNADRAISDAFAQQVKVGAGFVECRRNDDPFADPYVTDTLDWTNVRWDWKAQRPDLKDARYMVIERWFDEDQAELISPKAKTLCRASIQGYPFAEPLHDQIWDSDLVAGWQTQQSTKLQEDQWIDGLRRRVRFFDIYHRVPSRGKVMKSPDGQVTLFNEANPLHLGLAKGGFVTVQTARYTRMHRSIFMGPHLISTGFSPYPHDEFPVVPFFGYREGRSRIPYGLIRGMMGPQDEVNFRRSMLTWLLKARRVIMDEDATNMTPKELHEQVSRVDGVIKLNPERKNLQNSFSIQTEVQIAAQQFEVMKDAEQQIQAVSGVYNAMLGQNSNATSGIAINSLIEQGTITLTEIYDNYRFARQQVGNLMLHMIADDQSKQQKTVKVYASNPMRKTEQIEINKKNEYGELTNSVSMLNRRVVLADISQSPGYRAQLLDRLMQVAQTVPDNIKLILLNEILQLSELPRKEELMKKIQQAIGMGTSTEDMTPEQRAAQEEQQKAQRMALAVEMAAQQAEIADKNASAALKQSQAELNTQKVQSEQNNAQLIQARAEEILARIEGIQQDQILNERSQSLDQRYQAEQTLQRMLSQLPKPGQAPSQAT